MKKSLLMVSLLVLSVCVHAGQCRATDPDTVAVVGSQSISNGEMNEALKQPLFELDSQRYEAQKQWMDEKIESLLLEQEAQKRHLTRQKLEEQEIKNKVAKVTDTEIKKFYDQNKERFKEDPNQKEDVPLDKVKDRILGFLDRQNLQTRHAAYMDELRKKTMVTVNLMKPQPPKIAVTYGAQDAVLGKADAPVTIVEFTDFQCPYCVRSQETIREILKKYPNDVKIVTRNFPLAFHDRARPLALAALCAKEQGKYEPYREKIFGSTLDDKGLVEEAGKQGMDKASFDKCLTSKKYNAQIEQDIADGGKWGVSGTPAFFVNGYALTGARPIEDFDELIKKALAEKK